MERSPPLHSVHEEHGARTTEFGGWTMPVRYGSTKQEHRAVREAVGKFDVSHMGRVRVRGDDAVELTDRLTTNDVSGLAVGEAHYSTVVDEDGYLIDDVLVYRMADDDCMFVPNAGNDGEMVDRWREHGDRWGLDASVENSTEDTGMVAVQGPDSLDAVSAVADDLGVDGLSSLDRFEWTCGYFADAGGVVSRTGYTGEEGFELVVDADDAETVWRELEAEPCGLGARDTLRLEMGFLLAGNEFDRGDNMRAPWEAGVGFVVDLSTDFVGRDALEAKEDDVDERLVGFVLEERGVPRHGYTIEVDGEKVGVVSSGTMSPSLDEPIGLGYVDVEHAEECAEIQVVVRDEPKRARVEEPPFV